jgi:hypothetical protein
VGKSLSQSGQELGGWKEGGHAPGRSSGCMGGGQNDHASSVGEDCLSRAQLDGCFCAERKEGTASEKE